LGVLYGIVIGMPSILIYTAVVTYIILKVIGLMTGGLRVDEDQ
jgi:Amt family ammonium transporter